ncbi:serpin-ZX-like [Capsicum annuum]|uniref:serpin-ZX-like n=1 Tax=Capsicum annuum TaxID=4072 RepID=UPI001FB18B50|nr:serpin-ZX-like [Capsicum annuum]
MYFPSQFEYMHLRASIQKQTDISTMLAKHVFFSKFESTESNPNDANMVFSPLSIQIVLGLIAAGSSGDTLEQLLSFLKFNSVDELNSVYSRIIANVLANGSTMGGPRLSVANGAWIKQTLDFNPSFKQVMDNVYKAAAASVDSQHVYVSPKNVGVRKFLIPKFKIFFGIEASKVLKGLGLTLPFIDGLTEMVVNDFPLAVSKVFHKSFVEVNEEGTEAAAVNTFTMGPGCCRTMVKEERIDFVADHPFLFFVKDETSSVVLFTGTLLNPLAV